MEYLSLAMFVAVCLVLMAGYPVAYSLAGTSLVFASIGILTGHFDGAYLGCDIESGLGFPDWQILAQAFGIDAMTLSEGFQTDPSFLESWKSVNPCLYVVPVHPEQTYFPKIV